MILKVKKLHPDAKLPEYAHQGDAGMDLYALEDTIIRPGEREVIGTGIAIALPPGTCALFWDKSGLAGKHGVTILGGVIDEGYRGEYKVIMHNLGKEDFVVKKHMKIAQALIQRVESPQVVEVNEFEDETQRGIGAFGSTGRF